MGTISTPDIVEETAAGPPVPGDPLLDPTPLLPAVGAPAPDGLAAQPGATGPELGGEAAAPETAPAAAVAPAAAGGAVGAAALTAAPTAAPTQGGKQAAALGISTLLGAAATWALLDSK